MIRNYFKTAWRNLIKNKFYSAINIVGLTAGLTIGLLTLLWVQEQLSYDSFHRQAKNIYKVNIIGGTGISHQVFQSVIAPVATFAKNEIPEVKNAVRVTYAGPGAVYRYQAKRFIEDKVVYTDPSFFTMFDFPLIAGNKANPFPDNNTVVLTASTAKRYFGSADPLGKVITTDNNISLRVTGIIADFPGNTSLACNMLMPISLLNYLQYEKNSVSYNGTGVLKSMDADWVNFGYETFLQLQPGAFITRVEKKLQQIHERQKPDDAPVPYIVQPLLKMHLYQPEGGDAGIETVKLFAVVTLLILAIACINYVNLSTARAMLRAKEVSMRKIIGAGKVQLFLQFVLETALLFVIAAALALGLMYLLLPALNTFSGEHIQLNLNDFRLWMAIGIALSATLLASSIYPALLLISFEPLRALKGKLSAGIGSTSLRKVLVVTQFCISVILIAGMFIIKSQLNFITHKKLGYDRQHVFTFAMHHLDRHYAALKAELMKQNGIADVTRAGQNIIDYNGWTGDNDWEGKSPNTNLLFHPFQVDEHFIPFFKLKLLQGALFTGSIADSTHFLLNETAVAQMGIKNPIGKRLRLWKTHGVITGIVKDFYYSSMRKKIEPAIFTYSPKATWFVYVKAKANAEEEAISAAQKVWKQFNGDEPFSYTFLDETFNRLYRSEQHTGELFNIFAALAILLSCLGLFGLATYTAQVKTREIGIRKVLGASVLSVVKLLTTEFILLIVIAIVIATPVAWYVMNKWLMNFAYKVNINWWMFILAGCSAILIGLCTIGYQSVRAAIANPVKSLRSE